MHIMHVAYLGLVQLFLAHRINIEKTSIDFEKLSLLKKGTTPLVKKYHLKRRLGQLCKELRRWEEEGKKKIFFLRGKKGGWWRAYIDGKIDGWMDGWMDGQLRMYICMYGCMVVCGLAGWAVGWLGGCFDAGWMDRRIVDIYIYIYMYVSVYIEYPDTNMIHIYIERERFYGYICTNLLNI